LSIEPRLIVTGVGDDRPEAILSDDSPAPITVRALPGHDIYLLWGTRDGVPVVGARDTGPVTLPLYAGPGGTRLLFIRFAPESSVQVPDGDPAEIAAEAARVLPGLIEVVEPEGAGMHGADNIDYSICLEGELWLKLDGGEEVRVTPGTCVVQQGTRHAWYNHGDVPALMCFVGIGARRDPAASGGDS
jgi:hypothetical protein